MKLNSERAMKVVLRASWWIIRERARWKGSKAMMTTLSRAARGPKSGPTRKYRPTIPTEVKIAVG
jgi:hypothetical protein